MLRMEKDADKAKKLFGAIKKTGLYDKNWTCTKSMTILWMKQRNREAEYIPERLARNEAVFLHMEYKYFEI